MDVLLILFKKWNGVREKKNSNSDPFVFQPVPSVWTLLLLEGWLFFLLVSFSLSPSIPDPVLSSLSLSPTQEKEST